MKLRSPLLVLAVILLGSSHVEAQATWTDLGGTGNWSDAGGWLFGVLPTNNGTVSFTVFGETSTIDSRIALSFLNHPVVLLTGGVCGRGEPPVGTLTYEQRMTLRAPGVATRILPK